eukprot:4704807-Amphidinium_carterae.1
MNVAYKILAKMIRTRIATALDPLIVDFQYGFCQGRSASQPICIARRLTDIVEYSGASLYILVLDYAKAFDSIPFRILEHTLQRYGVPPQLTVMLMKICNCVQF